MPPVTPTSNPADAGESLNKIGISDVGLASLSQATSILQNLKGLLYDISANPLISAYGAIQLQTRIVNFTNQLKKLNEEAKESGKRFGMLGTILRDDRTWTGAGAAVFALGLKMQNFRDEVQKTQLALYRIQGTGALGGGGYAAAQGLTRQGINVRAQYGPDFEKNFRQTIFDLQRRMTQEKMNPAEQGRMAELITGLSMSTGANYSKAIQTLQDDFVQYGMTVPKALATTDMIREAWIKGKTAIGDLNDNIEAGVVLMKDFADSGMGMDRARDAMLGVQEAASQLHVTVATMLDLERATKGFAEIGEGGVQKRLQLAQGLQLTGMSDKMRDVLAKPEYRGLRAEEAVGVMRLSGAKGQVDLASFMQEYAKRVLPIDKRTGEIDLRAVMRHQGSIMTAAKAAGMDVETLLRMARGGEVAGAGAPAVGAGLPTFEAKLQDVTTKTLTQFDSALQTVIEDAITWSEKIEGMLKKAGTGFLDVSQAVANLTMAIGGALFVYQTLSKMTGGKLPGLGGMFGGMFGGGGGQGAPTPTGFGGPWTTTTMGQPTNQLPPVGTPAGRLGMKTVLGGYAANAATDAILSATTKQVNMGQGVVEGIASSIPFGSLAKVPGRILGGFFAAMFSKAPKNAFDEEVYKGYLQEEKAGLMKKGTAEKYRLGAAARNTALAAKYGYETMGRAVTGETLAEQGAPAITNEVNVYIDSVKVAAQVQDAQHHTAKASTNKMD